MKNFDLEAAKAGASVCTRDGRSVRIICFDRKNNKYPIVAILGKCEDEVEVFTDGGCYFFNERESDYDLFMVQTKHTGYVAMYRTEAGVPKAGARVYADRESAVADTEGLTSLIAICEVTWED